MEVAPDFIVAGHITLDKVNGEYLPGGSAYSALTAARLGRRVGLVTSFGPDLHFPIELEGVQIIAIPSPQSTVFVNVYHEGRREQQTTSIAGCLRAEVVPPNWRAVSAVHLAPMLGEVGPDFLDAFPKARMLASPQGWLRCLGPGGRVLPSSWNWADQAISRLDGMVVSSEDLAGDEETFGRWVAKIPCLVLTEGERGSHVYFGSKQWHIPAYITEKVVDPTGAGDAFAAAFLVKWSEGAGPYQAARFANIVASLVVEGKGLAGVPTLAQVEERLARSRLEEISDGGS